MSIAVFFLSFMSELWLIKRNRSFLLVSPTYCILQTFATRYEVNDIVTIAIYLLRKAMRL